MRSFAQPVAWLVAATLLASGCSVKKYAIRQVGDALNSGPSVFETDDDIELVGDALPFSLKFVETLLAEVPDDPDLLITACRGFVLYSYAYVDFEAERTVEVDLAEGRRMRARARRLYLRGMRYGFRGLERFYPGFEENLKGNPTEAAAVVNPKKADRDLPFLYWTSAALGLAIGVSKDDASMLARIPEVEAMIERSLAIRPEWDDGALHAFMVTFAGAKPGEPNREAMRRHFEEAMRLSSEADAGTLVSYAEAVAVPDQDATLFRDLLDRALAVDVDARPDDRLANLVAQRRARWLLERIEDLFLILPESTSNP